MTRPALTTTRLRLEPMMANHLPFLIELDSDPEVLRYLLGRARTAEEATEKWDPVTRDTRADRLGLGFWIGYLDREPIGWWHLVPADPDTADPARDSSVTRAELGYRVLRAFWRQGFASEGGEALLAHGFETLGLDEIWAETMAVNVGSRAVMARLGMTHTDTEHRHWDDPIPGTEQGEVIYRITADDWQARHAAPPLPQ